MRHRKTGKTLDRPRAARVALLKHLATSVIVHDHVVTTDARARAVRPIIERAITRAKSPSLANRRQLLRQFAPTTVQHLLTILGPRFQARPGGYTRVLKQARRRGDGAALVVVQLTAAGEK